MKKYVSVILLIVMVFSIYPTYTVSAKENCNWKKLYGEYLQENFSDKKECKAALIYVDGDEIPEVYVKDPDDICMANEGCWLLSIYKNKVRMSSVPNNSFKYAPKKNRIYYHQGAGAYIIDTTRMEKLERGKVATLWTSMKDVDPTQLKQPTLYYINDKQVSKKYYQRYISKNTSKYKWKTADKQLKSLNTLEKQLCE